MSGNIANYGKRRIRQFFKLLSLLRVARFRRALRHGVGATVEHSRLLGSLDIATVVDIGANKGQFSLAAAEAFPRAHIHAFEPLREPAATFAALFAGEARVALYRAAIGPSKTTAAINVSRRDDSSSLLEITALQEDLFPGTGLARTEEIEVGPLDSFVTAGDLAAPALLKLDVQGYELEALRGCESLLVEFAHVYVECSFVELYAGQAFAGEIIAWLRERGFELRCVFNMTYDRAGLAVQADFLFAR